MAFANMLREMTQWLARSYPYWNRTGEIWCVMCDGMRVTWGGV